MFKHKGKQIHGGDVYRNKGYIDFSVNINPLGMPPRVKEEVVKQLEQVGHYPDIYCERLCREIAEYEQVEEDFLICGNGASELIYGLVQSLRPKSGLVLAPTFAEYGRALESVGARVVLHNLEKDFRLGEGILDEIGKVDVVFLCNPNNPTGELIERGLLQNIVEVCERKKVYLVIDECFLDFVEEKEVYEMKPYCNRHSYLFVLKAFTKIFGMAGLRLGYGISGNQKLLGGICKVLQPWNVSSLAQVAGVVALQEREPYLTNTKIFINREKEKLKGALEEKGIQIFGSKANYIFFKGEGTFLEEAKRAGFLIRDCRNYPRLEAGYYRIGVQTEAENERMIQWLRKL